MARSVATAAVAVATVPLAWVSFTPSPAFQRTARLILNTTMPFQMPHWPSMAPMNRGCLVKDARFWALARKVRQSLPRAFDVTSR